MFDFGSNGSMFESLDADTRLAVANLLQQRNEYAELMMEVNRRKIQILMNPTAEAEQDLAEYTSAVVAPMRMKMSQDTVALLGKAVDVEAIKGLLPIILLGLTQSIDLPLLFTVMGLDPDMIAESVGYIKEYFSDHIS